MWKPETWNSEGLASFGEAMVVHGRLDLSVAEMRNEPIIPNCQAQIIGDRRVDRLWE
jgi:hypothetical protein